MTLTIKQEAFCFAYLETGNACEAYRQAYDTTTMKAETIKRKAKELLDHNKVSAKIQELRNAAATRNEITVDDLLNELEAVRQKALSLPMPQCSAAVSATMGKAKLLGIGNDKIELTGRNGGPIQHRNSEQKTDDEITKELSGLLCQMLGIEDKEAPKAFETSLITGLPVRQCV